MKLIELYLRVIVFFFGSFLIFSSIYVWFDAPESWDIFGLVLVSAFLHFVGVMVVAFAWKWFD